MGASYAHNNRVDGIKLVAAIYNADHQNHIDNAIPSLADDYSANVSQMRSTADPGESGTESLPTSMAGELERLRFTVKELKEMVGGASIPQWYTSLTSGQWAASILTQILNWNSASNSFAYNITNQTCSIKLSNGLMIQAGKVNGLSAPSGAGSGAFVDFNFHEAFPNANIFMVSTLGFPNTGNENEQVLLSTYPLTVSTGRGRITRWAGTNTGSEQVYFTWVAIGGTPTTTTP